MKIEPMAFPIKLNDNLTQIGMTLRDYFAAKAMQGMLAAGANWHEPEKAIDLAIKWADTMIKAREEK